MKESQIRPRLPLSVGSEGEWDELIKLAKIHTVKDVLSKLSDDNQDIPSLLKRRLKEKPFISKPAKRGKTKTYLILGCVHRPHHSKKLWASIMQLIYDLRKDISGIVINGDFLDLSAISKYGVGKKGSGFTLMDEYEDGLEGLMEIESALGKRKNDVEKHFLFGNHEARWNFHVDKLEVSKYGRALLNPIDGLRLDDLGYNVQTDYQNGYIELGKNLEVFHGSYFNQHSAAKHLQSAKGKSVIFNHTHRFQIFSDNKATAYNLGCLINLEDKAFNYATRFTKSHWKNAFGLVHIDSNGEHIVNPIECKNERFWFGGKKY